MNLWADTQTELPKDTSRAVGYGALEVIRDTTSDSDVTKVKHIPAQTLRRHADKKRVLHITPAGKKVWFVIYGKNYDDNGTLCDVSADDGTFHPYNSLSPSERANEILWTMEMEKMEEKIDKMNENIQQLILKSNQGDTDLELRLKAIETELALQKQTTTENHNRVSSLLAVVGVGLTIITILINVYFNMT